MQTPRKWSLSSLGESRPGVTRTDTWGRPWAQTQRTSSHVGLHNRCRPVASVFVAEPDRPAPNDGRSSDLARARRPLAARSEHVHPQGQLIDARRFPRWLSSSHIREGVHLNRTHPLEQIVREAEGERLVDVEQQDRELVAPEASDGVALTQSVGHRCGDRAQQLVAGEMPEIVVDGLHPVEVEDQQRTRTAVAAAAGNEARQLGGRAGGDGAWSGAAGLPGPRGARRPVVIGGVAVRLLCEVKTRIGPVDGFVE